MMKLLRSLERLLTEHSDLAAAIGSMWMDGEKIHKHKHKKVLRYKLVFASGNSGRIRIFWNICVWYRCRRFQPCNWGPQIKHCRARRRPLHSFSRVDFHHWPHITRSWRGISCPTKCRRIMAYYGTHMCQSCVNFTSLLRYFFKKVTEDYYYKVLIFNDMERPVIVVSTIWLHLWYIARQAGYSSVKSLVPPSLIYRMRVMNLTVHTLLTPRLFTCREGSLARIKDAMSFVR